MSNVITTKFDSFFTLDSSKLSRLLSVIEDRFKDISNEIVSNHEISTRNGKSFSTSDIETILEHDNPINNPITTLSISYQDKKQEPAKIVNIQFDKDESRIKVKIQAEEPRFGNDLYAEIEEQLERTQNKSWAYSIKKQKPHELLMVLIMVIMLPLMLLLVFATFPEQELKKRDYLSKEDISFLSAEYSKSITENEKLDYLYEYHARKIANMNKSKSNLLKLFSKENIFNLKVCLLVLPFVVVLFSIYYIVSKTYLGSIFLWGDFVDYNNTLLERRKFVWNTIVVAIIIGVISNLFVFGFSKFF